MKLLSRRALAGFAAAPFAARAARRPNLLILVADSWRGQALPMAGDSNVRTPNLQRLAREGEYHSRAYTSYPVCCPSRAAMLTGKMPHAAGVRVNHSRLPLDQRTMSAAMKAAGYRTGYIGKWHLDGGESPGFVPPERRRGFDEWYAYNLAHRHYGSVYFHDDPKPIPIPGFEPDGLTDLALDFLRRNRAQPWYLHLAIVAPHAPLTPPPRHATFRPEALQLRNNVPRSSESAARKDLAGYYGLCTAVDENIGRILGELDSLGAVEDTIVVFTSDHGHTLWSHGIDEIDVPYEEAVRIPLLIRHPRRLRAGATKDLPISNIHFAAMLMKQCGVAGWKNSNDGTVRAEGSLDQPGEWHMVLHGRYKLVVDAKQQPKRLYDLERDPYEQQNVASDAAMKPVIRRLLTRSNSSPG